MYPPDTANKITVEVSCCNAIGQCATSEFRILPKDTKPTSLITTLDTTFVIQYDPDSVSSVGQGFNWAMSNAYFYDVDKSSDTQDTSYHVTDHRVYMDFVNPNTYFRQVTKTGLVFG